MLASALIVTLGSTAPAFAFEYPIGKPQTRAGVGPWFQPFTLDCDFAFAGLGRKGRY